MVEKCESCRSWVDDIYWTHFKFTHFAQRLPAGFNHHLALPKRFSDSLKRKLPDNVTLKGPGGAEWTVKLATRDDTLHFTHGWQQFAQEHFLEENDLLIFKYNGESQFDVLIFDQKNFCEKAASYFVREGGHTNKRNRDNCVEEVDVPSTIDVKLPSPKKSTQGKSKMTRKAAVESTPAKQTTRSRRSRGSNVHAQEVEWVADVVPASASRNRMVEIVDVSGGRTITEKRKDVLQLAQAACTADDFYVVMRPSHVYRRFYVTIPTKWITEHLPPQSEDVILRVGESEWPAKYSFEPSRCTGGLMGGWKQFALENNLQEYDVCVFHLAVFAKRPLILEVKIFRVDEV